MVMRRLTLQGVAPSDAARIALTASVPSAEPSLGYVPAPGESPDPGALGMTAELVAGPAPGFDEEEAQLQLADAQDPFSELDLSAARGAGEFDLEDEGVLALPWREEREEQTAWLGVLRRAAGRGAAGGGRVVAMPDGTPRSRGLARAAMSLDTQEMHRMLLDAVRSFGTVETWTELIMPVLRALGERTSATGDGIDVEHAFTEVLLGIFRAPIGLVRQPRNHSPVLLSCAEGDRHSLPLHALAAALAERQVSSRMLGGGMPAASLAAAVRRTGPSVIALYARLPGADARTTEQLRRQRPTPTVILCGPGWTPETVPTFARQANSLEDAVDAVLTATAHT
jgi:hypothetical protein